MEVSFFSISFPTHNIVAFMFYATSLSHKDLILQFLETKYLNIT